MQKPSRSGGLRNDKAALLCAAVLPLVLNCYVSSLRLLALLISFMRV